MDARLVARITVVEVCARSEDYEAYLLTSVECRMINTILIPEEREEFRDILLDFEFSDSPSICAVQTLFVLVHNLPLALHVLSVGMRRLAQTAAVLTIFFEDIQAVHRFVSHVVHAVVAYSSHEDFVTSKLRRVGIDQTVNDELRGVMRKKGEKVLLRGYTQGGVGHGLVKIEGFEMQNDWQLAVWVGNGERGVLVGAKCTSRQVGLVF